MACHQISVKAYQLGWCGTENTLLFQDTTKTGEVNTFLSILRPVKFHVPDTIVVADILPDMLSQ